MKFALILFGTSVAVGNAAGTKACTCNNGVADTDNDCRSAGRQSWGCSSCKTNFKLLPRLLSDRLTEHATKKVCVRKVGPQRDCACNKGRVDDQKCWSEGGQSCESCESGFQLVEKVDSDGESFRHHFNDRGTLISNKGKFECKAPCVCPNGEAADDAMCWTKTGKDCVSCDSGYRLKRSTGLRPDGTRSNKKFCTRKREFRSYKCANGTPVSGLHSTKTKWRQNNCAVCDTGVETQQIGNTNRQKCQKNVLCSCTNLSGDVVGEIDEDAKCWTVGAQACSSCDDAHVLFEMANGKVSKSLLFLPSPLPSLTPTHLPLLVPPENVQVERGVRPLRAGVPDGRRDHRHTRSPREPVRAHRLHGLELPRLVLVLPEG